MSDELDQLAIHTIRTLSIDAVQHANSGHLGTPMAPAPAVYTTWNRVMNFDPDDSIWPDRDRFVLSKRPCLDAGHLGLDNLCWLYDSNHITIEGNTNITFTEDIATRFLGYGWNVLRVGDANDEAT